MSLWSPDPPETVRVNGKLIHVNRSIFRALYEDIKAIKKQLNMPYDETYLDFCQRIVNNPDERDIIPETKKSWFDEKFFG